MPQLYIDPTECIDCGACVPVCPVTAIFALDDLPEKWHVYIETNKNSLTAVNFSPTGIKKQGADGRLGTAPGTYEYAARNHS
jgi:ferredoxin